MLMLLFFVGEDRYAINIKHIVQVLPKVPVKKIINVPDYMVGLLIYKGIPIPVVDFSYLLTKRFCSTAMHSRIIVLENEDAVGNKHYLGILAERVMRMIDKQENEFIDVCYQMRDVPYLGKVLTDEKGTIQFVYVEAIFKMIHENSIETSKP